MKISLILSCLAAALFGSGCAGLPYLSVHDEKLRDHPTIPDKRTDPTGYIKEVAYWKEEPHTLSIPAKTNIIVTWEQRANPIWWFGNADEPKPPSWYIPKDISEISGGASYGIPCTTSRATSSDSRIPEASGAAVILSSSPTRTAAGMSRSSLTGICASSTSHIKESAGSSSPATGSTAQQRSNSIEGTKPDKKKELQPPSPTRSC